MGENPKPNSDVTSASGYTVEDRVKLRNSNGYGGTQTRLPEGHLARRDTIPRLKRIRRGGVGDE
jgi:hypothetical protein